MTPYKTSGFWESIFGKVNVPSPKASRSLFPDQTKALFWQAKLDGYGQSVDQRVKFAGGMKEFTKRGSNLVLVINNVDLRTSTVTARPMIWCSLLPARERNRGLRSLVILPWSFRLTRWRPQTLQSLFGTAPHKIPRAKIKRKRSVKHMLK
jgi:hypothetical protein